MKTIARIYKWVMLSVILQFIFLLFINNYYLGRNGEIKLTSLDNEGRVKKDINVKISGEASNITVSHDAAYAAYIAGGNIGIFDLHRKKTIGTIASEGEKITYLRWLTDRNMLIYAEKSIKDQKGNVSITTWDVDSGMKRDYPPITKLDKQCEVVDIELSALTNIVYVKVKLNETKASIYKYNIMDNLSHVMSTATDTTIKETAYTDKLVYQGSTNRVFVKDSIKGNTWQIPFKNRMVLLGIDSEDKVYAGELNSLNRVYKIHFGKITSNSIKSWEQVSLGMPVLQENLVVAPDDAIYEIIQKENAILDIQNDKKIEFKGEFIEILKGYVVSRDGRELRLKVIS